MKIFYIQILILVSFSLWSQNWEFAKGFGGNNSSIKPQSIIVDSKGNTYVTGYIQGKPQFEEILIVTPPLIFEPFIAKYNNLGVLQWAKPIVMTGINNYGSGQGIALNSIGEIFVTGYFSGTASFGNPVNNLQTISTGTDAFVAKYANNGNPIWAKQLGHVAPNGNIQNSVKGFSITVDINNYYYLTGYFINQALFGQNLLISQNGQGDVFISKGDKDGNQIWTKRAGGTNFEIGKSISVDAVGNCFVTGDFFSNTSFFGPYTLTSNNNQEANFFIACLYQKSGEFKWVKQAKTANNGLINFTIGEGVSKDENGGCFVTGSFTGNVNFSNVGIVSSGFNLESLDMFVAHYDQYGALLWLHREGGEGDESGRGISYNPISGKLYVCGSFTGKSVFNNGTEIINNPSDNSNIYVASYDSSGLFDFINRSSGINNANAFAITINPNSNDVFVTGLNPSSNDMFFNNSFNGNVGINLPSINLGKNGFVAKLKDTFNAVQRIESNTSNILKDCTKIYPNPASEQFTISTTVEENTWVSVTIYNLVGTKVYSFSGKASESEFTKTIAVSAFESGIYFVQFENGINRFSKKIIIK